MTMADTIAVMNAGEIEQMGAPADLYEHPRTTFVANFLGQSNLLPGSVERVAGRTVDVRLENGVVHADTDRAAVTHGDAWVGVRPEKVVLQRPGEGPTGAGAENRLEGGIVSDVSFVGVSTQYLVKMPWGQELQVFEQNTGRRRIFRTGDKVELSWRPEYAFLLDHEQDASAGSQLDDE
jgi:spermidine/putrescine transport system ATP-binding protein